MIYFLTVNYYSTNLIEKLISSLPVNKNIEYITVIVNNSPDDDAVKVLESNSVLILDAEYNIGFGCACNLGIEWIYTQNNQAIIWIINPDAYLSEHCLEKVNKFFKTHPEVSILGTIIHTPTDEVWFAGGNFLPATGAILSPDLLANTDTDYIASDWVSGCSMIINLGNFGDRPFFDPAYFLYYEDFDFCRRYAEQGHLIAVTKKFGVGHQPSSITNRYTFRKIKHSTYSYLLTLQRYSNTMIFNLRLARLIVYAVILLFIKPQVAFGKLYGVLIYFNTLVASILRGKDFA